MSKIIEYKGILTRNSLVNKYVTIVVSDEKSGARNTQTLRISTAMFKSQQKW